MKRLYDRHLTQSLSLQQLTHSRVRCVRLRSGRHERECVGRRAVRHVERPVLLCAGLHGRPVPQLQRGILPLERERHVSALLSLSVGHLYDFRLQRRVSIVLKYFGTQSSPIILMFQT